VQTKGIYFIPSSAGSSTPSLTPNATGTTLYVGNEDTKTNLQVYGRLIATNVPSLPADVIRKVELDDLDSSITT
jgi:hypothetical protein